MWVMSYQFSRARNSFSIEVTAGSTVTTEHPIACIERWAKRAQDEAERGGYKPARYALCWYKELTAAEQQQLNDAGVQLDSCDHEISLA